MDLTTIYQHLPFLLSPSLRFNLYQTGSRLYGTADENADYDFFCIIENKYYDALHELFSIAHNHKEQMVKQSTGVKSYGKREKLVNGTFELSLPSSPLPATTTETEASSSITTTSTTTTTNIVTSSSFQISNENQIELVKHFSNQWQLISDEQYQCLYYQCQEQYHHHQQQEGHKMLPLININLYSEGQFQQKLDINWLQSFICVFMPEKFILKQDLLLNDEGMADGGFFRMKYEISFRKLGIAVVGEAGKHYEMARKKWNENDVDGAVSDNELKSSFDRAESSTYHYNAKKFIVHALRDFLFGIQIVTKGRIEDFSAANKYFYEIMQMKDDDYKIYDQKYSPIYEKLKEDFNTLSKKKKKSTSDKKKKGIKRNSETPIKKSVRLQIIDFLTNPKHETSEHAMVLLKKFYSIQSMRHPIYPNLIHFSYSINESPTERMEVLESNGLILLESKNDLNTNFNSYSVVCYPPNRIMNFTDHFAPEIDWNHCKVFPDTACAQVTLFYFQNKWRISTFQNIVASKTFLVKGRNHRDKSVQKFESTTTADVTIGGDEENSESAMNIEHEFWTLFHKRQFKLPDDPEYCFTFEIALEGTSSVQYFPIVHQSNRLQLYSVRNLQTLLEEFDHEKFAMKYNWDYSHALKEKLKNTEIAINYTCSLNPFQFIGINMLDIHGNRLRIISTQHYHLLSLVEKGESLTSVLKNILVLDIVRCVPPWGSNSDNIPEPLLIYFDKLSNHSTELVNMYKEVNTKYARMCLYLQSLYDHLKVNSGEKKENVKIIEQLRQNAIKDKKLHPKGSNLLSIFMNMLQQKNVFHPIHHMFGYFQQVHLREVLPFYIGFEAKNENDDSLLKYFPTSKIKHYL